MDSFIFKGKDPFKPCLSLPIRATSFLPSTVSLVFWDASVASKLVWACLNCNQRYHCNLACTSSNDREDAAHIFQQRFVTQVRTKTTQTDTLACADIYAAMALLPLSPGLARWKLMWDMTSQSTTTSLIATNTLNRSQGFQAAWTFVSSTLEGHHKVCKMNSYEAKLTQNKNKTFLSSDFTFKALLFNCSFLLCSFFLTPNVPWNIPQE